MKLYKKPIITVDSGMAEGITLQAVVKVMLFRSNARILLPIGVDLVNEIFHLI